MKAIFIFLSLWAVSLTVGAQNREVEQAMREWLATPGVTTSESIVRERDLSQPGNPMKSMCEVWEFTCDVSLLSRIEHLSALMKANSTSDNCYYVKTHTPGHTDWHDILVGDDPSRVVELGRSERSHYTLVNFLDTLDATKSHRYAYALEWQEQNTPFKLKEQNGKLIKVPVTEKTIKGKVVMTYARVPKPNQQLQSENVKGYNASYITNKGILELIKNGLRGGDINETYKSLIQQWIDEMIEQSDE